MPTTFLNVNLDWSAGAANDAIVHFMYQDYEVEQDLSQLDSNVKIRMPTGLTATDGTLERAVELTWNEVPSAVGYKVIRDPGTAGETTVLDGSSGYTVTSGTVSFTDNTGDGAEYEYIVLAKDANPEDNSAFTSPIIGKGYDYVEMSRTINLTSGQTDSFSIPAESFDIQLTINTLAASRGLEEYDYINEWGEGILTNYGNGGKGDNLLISVPNDGYNISAVAANGQSGYYNGGSGAVEYTLHFDSYGASGAGGGSSAIIIGNYKWVAGGGGGCGLYDGNWGVFKGGGGAGATGDGGDAPNDNIRDNEANSRIQGNNPGGDGGARSYNGSSYTGPLHATSGGLRADLGSWGTNTTHNSTSGIVDAVITWKE